MIPGGTGPPRLHTGPRYRAYTHRTLSGFACGACVCLARAVVEVFRVGDLVYIIMEKADGGELFDRLLEQPGSHYSESYTRKLCARILSALRYLHARNIVHRDLKLENVLFSADPSIAKHATVKLIDFGFSHVYLTGSVMTDLIGTPFYLAPEVLKQTYTDASSDMWSFGVIVCVNTPPTPTLAALHRPLAHLPSCCSRAGQ